MRLNKAQKAVLILITQTAKEIGFKAKQQPNFGLNYLFPRDWECDLIHKNVRDGMYVTGISIYGKGAKVAVSARFHDYSASIPATIELEVADPTFKQKLKSALRSLLSFNTLLHKTMQSIRRRAATLMKDERLMEWHIIGKSK